MPRSVWTGSISFGLVSVPVRLVSAVERGNELSFRLLHARDHARIDYKRFCEAEEIEVPWSEIVKGYEHERGQYVVLTSEDFERARTPATQRFDIRDFVPARAIDFMYFDHPYYLAPSGRGAAKSYALLRDALAETGRVGVGTIVLRQREQLAALEPAGRALALTTMRFAYEIRTPDDLDLPEPGAGWTEREMKLARQLIETLESDWEPERYRDTYREVLLDVIQKKLEGKEVDAPAIPKPRPVANLVKALEESLAARRGAAKAEPRRKRARPGRRRPAA
jgi:DNA end-binding protein Ku